MKRMFASFNMHMFFAQKRFTDATSANRQDALPVGILLF